MSANKIRRRRDEQLHHLPNHHHHRSPCHLLLPTLNTGKVQLPPSTNTSINVTFDGVTREASATDTTLITFASPDGDHTYSAQALSGTTILASLGPISITTRSSFPLTIPLSFSYPSFDTYQTDIGLNTPNTLIYFGDDQRKKSHRPVWRGSG